MPVSDFECQIARGQIGRYLGGDTLSPEALSGLEDHVAECPGCKGLVAERRAALLGQLDETPTHAVASVPAKGAANPLVAAIRARNEALEEEAPAPKPKAAPRYVGAKAKPAPTKPRLGKPLALAAVLAIVLVAMSTLSRSVGDQAARASAVFADRTLPSAPTPVSEPTPKPVETPLATKAATVVKPEPKLLAKPAPKVVAPKPSVPSVAAKSASIRPKTVVAPKPVVKAVAKAKPAPTKRAFTAPKTAVHRRLLTPRRPFARRLRRLKPRATVRVYRPDGRPL